MPGTGIFGGTFNPIHHGHLLLADEVREALALDRVLFVPAGVPPHRADEDLAPADDRYRMVELATAGYPGLGVSDVELGRPGPSYTVDTLATLARSVGDLHLIMGSETFFDLPTWREPRTVAALARLVVVPRATRAFDPDGAPAREVLAALGSPGFADVGPAKAAPGAVLLVRVTSLPVSASEIRRRARAGRSLAFRVPRAVEDHIRARRLWGAAPR